ncbi:Ger(x)C family spore germination protein [Bacillus marasmi]|uniref:Ger(x)C family spore germination protein n=1 Tax=Bacillus marasmi TaxID=1926279 RepID=UPI0011CB06B7|nr:Ger(x)C family spore germination protein [Bacillus marasmi]
MKWAKSCMLILLIPFLLSGCWDKIELNDIGIITGIAVEKGEKHKYKYTVSSVNASELSKTTAMGNTSNITFSLEGNSISELARKMNVAMSRRLIYSHTRVLIIDKELAEEGIVGFLDFLERSGEFRNDFNILIAEGAKASDVLRMTYPIHRDPSLKLHSQLDALLEDWGGDPNVRLTDFIIAITSKGINPVCAVVTIKGDPKKGKTVENNKSNQLDAILVINGLAIFKLDKLIGTLPIEDTRNYLWTQDLKRTNITVECGEDENNKKLYNDIQIVSSASNLSSSFHKGKADLKVQITGEAKLLGTQCQEPLKDLKTYKKYESDMNELIVESVTNMIKTVQEEYKTDVFGFGEYLNRKQHKAFEKIADDWEEYFTNASVKVESNLFIRRTGVRNNSFITEIEEIKKKEREKE